MKREILCESCAPKVRKLALPSEPGEGYAAVPGKLKASCQCDYCSQPLNAGDSAVASSMYIDGRYYPWEEDYLNVHA